MYSRWFNIGVVVLWLSAMTWLVVAKVLPPLLTGQPPSYRSILEAQKREGPVAWRMSLGGKKIGMAWSTTKPLPNGLVELHSRVHFNRVPLEKLVPAFVRHLLVGLERRAPSLEIASESTLTIDPLGRLLRFDSSVRFEPLGETIKLRGVVEGTLLKLSLRVGESTEPAEVYFPPNALLTGTLSPQTQLPGLKAGQQWTVKVYNPLSPLPPREPEEILQARVEDRVPVFFSGRAENVWLVVYRSDSGSRTGGTSPPRGRLWVRGDGTVLKQETLIFGSAMTFERLGSNAAAALKQAIDD